MLICLLQLLVVGCWGIQWKAMNDFKKSFERYSTASTNTINHIQKILDSSKTESEFFFNNTYSNNPVVKRIITSRPSNDKCVSRFIDEENLKFLFDNQIYQLQLPLRRRLLEVRDRINKINSSIDIYERVARSIFRSCQAQHRNCYEETVEWLKSTIYSISCAIHPNCHITTNQTNHFIKKRTICHPLHFSCEYGRCITGNFYCDGKCDCADCSDEPDDCIKNCTGFRCIETFRCVSNNKKCDGIDDCGDETDEEGCLTDRTSTIKPVFRINDCFAIAGEFLCKNKKCISTYNVCDGQDDCGDWSDEGIHCQVSKCSTECNRQGRVCLTSSKGSECVLECPPETYETSKGCSFTPDAPPTTLVQFIEDTPRLTTRYGARLKFLKSKTIKTIYKSLDEVIKCKKQGFSLLSSSIDYRSSDIDTRNDDIPKVPSQNIIKNKTLHEFTKNKYKTETISNDSGSDESKFERRSANSKRTLNNQVNIINIDNDNMPGQLSGEPDNDKNNASSFNSKTSCINLASEQIIDDENMAGRLSGESSKIKNRPSSTNSRTNSINQTPKNIVGGDNFPGKLSVDSEKIIDDENMPGRLSFEIGDHKHMVSPTNSKVDTSEVGDKKNRAPSKISQTNVTKQAPKEIIEDNNAEGRVSGQSGSYKNKADPSFNSSFTNQVSKENLGNDTIPGKISFGTGNDKNNKGKTSKLESYENNKMISAHKQSKSTSSKTQSMFKPKDQQSEKYQKYRPDALITKDRQNISDSYNPQSESTDSKTKTNPKNALSKKPTTYIQITKIYTDAKNKTDPRNSEIKAVANSQNSRSNQGNHDKRRCRIRRKQMIV